MKGRLSSFALVVGACVAGVACGRWAFSSTACRDVIGIFCGRGHLLVLVHGNGIYEADLQRAVAESHFAAGIDEKHRPQQRMDDGLILRLLVSNAMVRSLAANEKISAAEIEGHLNLLRCQFRAEETWRTALRANGLSVRSLRTAIAADLRARLWILEQTAPYVDVTMDECRSLYDAHPESFFQPIRLRASHLFLPAPPETPPEIVEEKHTAIELLSDRLAHGESFADLVADASEDEATKRRSGDLGFFSAVRMPLDFFAEALKLQVGQVSPPIRTRLGFHLVQLTDLKPARQMGCDETCAEIAVALENRNRRAFLEKLIVDLFCSSRVVTTFCSRWP